MEDTKKVEKNLDYYMSLPYAVEIIPSPEGGYAGRVQDLPGCITQGETVEEILYMIEDAKKCWLSSALEDEDEIPEPADPFKPDGRLQLRIPRSLHKKLTKCASLEGVSVNQMVTYLIASGLNEKILEEK